MTMNLESAIHRLTQLFEQTAMPSLPGNDVPVVVYGGGDCGRDVLHVLREAGYNVAAFLDANAAKICRIENVPCYLPEGPEARRLAAGQMPVVIAVFNYATDTGAIENSLRHYGFKNILPYYAAAATLPNLKSRFWFRPRKFLEQHIDDIRRGLELWADDKSREIYLQLVELRLTGNLQLLRQPDRAHQYFPEDLPPLREPVRLIDGGAFTGDTLAALGRFHLEAVAAFEPDLENFRALRHWLKNNGAGITEAVLFPCGLDSKTAMRRFKTGQGEGSAVMSTGDVTIPVVALDDVLPHFAPTFIKFDIEGAEMSALMGATEMIKKNQPRIAVCLYHKPADLWEIPLLMQQIAPKQQLFLRYHAFNGLEIVAYAFEP